MPAQSSVYVVDDPSSVCTVVDGVVKTELPPASINFACTDGKMHNASTWLGIAGLMLMGILMSRSFKGSIITGVHSFTFIHYTLSKSKIRNAAAITGVIAVSPALHASM